MFGYQLKKILSEFNDQVHFRLAGALPHTIVILGSSQSKQTLSQAFLVIKAEEGGDHVLSLNVSPQK